MLEIITRTPVWVWPLLVLLLWLGFRASKDRTMPIAPFFIFPFLGLISINNLFAFSNQLLVWSIYPCAYLLGGWLGVSLQRKLTVRYEKGRVAVLGEWVTLFSIFLIFTSSFLNGMLNAIAPDILNQIVVYAPMVTIKAGVAGVFLGRGAYILRLAVMTNRKAATSI